MKLIFVHGQESSGHGFKGNFLRKIFPQIETPDFEGDLAARMAQLRPILHNRGPWTVIGSSFGGLMATLYSMEHPEDIARLILLAPALVPEFLPPGQVVRRISIPVSIIHGIHDDVVDLNVALEKAREIFVHISHHPVDDGHRLIETTPKLDWSRLIEGKFFYK